MEGIRKGKIIKRISWTETLRSLQVGEYVVANLSERINIVRHISRISKEENKKFSTKKRNDVKVEIKREV